jgi:SAM-dependent methyltransferase
MQERHQNKEKYFQEQALTTRRYIIPYIETFIEINESIKVLEIGCGEGGNLLPFLDIGCRSVGVDISEGRISLAEKYFNNHPNRKNLLLIAEDIYNAGYLAETFDLIILRDVIEHIPNQEVFMHFVKRFLKPGGFIFFGFPPWQNPFGGHQQIIGNKILSKLPWFHLLPYPLYRLILKLGGASGATIQTLFEIKDTRISIERFEKIIKKENYTVAGKTFYLINPNYYTKFGLKPRVQLGLISSIPRVRNFFITAAYYLLKAEGNH